MHHELAIALSRSLAEAGIAHSLQVGYHENMAPPVQCYVSLPIPRRYNGGIGAAIARLEEIAEANGLVLGTGMMNEGLTFSTPTHAEELERRLKGVH